MKKQSASSCFLFLILVALILCSHQTPEERKRSRKMTCMNVKLHHWQSPTQPIINAVVWNICSNVSVTDVGRRTISRASAQRVDPPYRCDGACCVLLTATIRLNMIYQASVCLFIKDVKWRESCHVNSHMTNIWRRPHLHWFALLYICHVSDVYSSNYRALCKLGPQNLSERKAVRSRCAPKQWVSSSHRENFIVKKVYWDWPDMMQGTVGILSLISFSSFKGPENSIYIFYKG